MNLDAALIAAHEQRDLAQLVRLYQQAAQYCFEQGNIDAGCFYLTHAYIFALDCNHADSAQIHAVLVKYDRES